MSKVLFPSLRIGYAIVPPELVEAFVGARTLMDKQSPTAEQHVLAAYMSEGYFEAHVRRIRMADIVVTNAKSAAACLYGLPEAPLEDISIVNTQIHLTEDTPSFPVMNAVQQPVTLAGLTAEHVRGLHLTDLRIVGARGETVTLHDVE